MKDLMINVNNNCDGQQEVYFQIPHWIIETTYIFSEAEGLVN